MRAWPPRLRMACAARFAELFFRWHDAFVEPFLPLYTAYAMSSFSL